MHRAIDKLTHSPEALIIDGNRFDAYVPGLPREDALATRSADALMLQMGTSLPLPHTCIVKGDGKYLSIAAASILAKTYRDDYMNELAEEYPMYDWLSNKGYPTKKHRAALAEYGPSPYHRMTFKW